MLKVLSNILCDLDPKVKVIGQKAGICDGVPSTSALVPFNLICNMATYRKKKCFDLYIAPQGSRMCVRAKQLLPCCHTPHSL